MKGRSRVMGLACALVFLSFVCAWAEGLPGSVTAVPTAVPVFIGHTEKMPENVMEPVSVSNMAEYVALFGGAPVLGFSLEEKGAGSPDASDVVLNGKSFSLTQSSERYILYRSLELFFQNGGGPCSIVSVGDYSDAVETEGLIRGLGALSGEDGPTLVVIPEAVLLDGAGCSAVQQAALRRCAEPGRSRFAILDVRGGDRPSSDSSADCITAFRDGIGSADLGLGAAYYPWLNTSVVQERDLGFENLTPLSLLQRLLTEELSQGRGEASAAESGAMASVISKMTSPLLTHAEKTGINNALVAESPLFNTLFKAMKERANLLPPSGAVAGAYAMTDNSRGVWQAPANISLNSVCSPAVTVSGDRQEFLAIPPDGLSVNAIRAFPGEGTLIWGARTLDGNSPDWRYVNVRRTVMMIEASITEALKGCASKPNTPATWGKVTPLIRHFLMDLWKEGGVAGADPDDAFNITVGASDVDAGMMRVVVKVAVSRPGQFIPITMDVRTGASE